MNITTKFMTRNDCYNAGRKLKPKGIMVHSTATPGVMAAAWFDRWNKSFKAGETDREVCVHAFLDDNGVWQYLPWDRRGWHAGGSANNTHIGFEICEPAGFHYGHGPEMIGYDPKAHEAYFRKAWDNAVALCVMLCREYKLTEKNIICHSEGHKLGIASNHGDVMHWFPKHHESMDTFRAAVKKALASENVIPPNVPNPPNHITYTVQADDTLWGIAQKKLGSGTRYVEIKTVNGLASDTIHAGQVLKIPK